MADENTDQDGAPLVVGAFYWALPAFDPDTDETWQNEAQPARFVGYAPERWNWLAVDGEPDWPARYVGKRIIECCGQRDVLQLLQPTPQQLLILRRHRIAEAEYLMGKGEQGNGPPDYPPEICDPLTGDLFPWARIKPPGS